MKIGIAGPITLTLLNFDFTGKFIPTEHSSPVTSMLINALLKRGHQVVAFTTSGEIEEPIVYTSENLTICIARHGVHPGRNLFQTARKDLVALMQKYPVDIINAHWSYEFAWAAVDSGIPTVVTLKDHATTILKYHFDAYRTMRWIMNYVVLKKAKFLTTNSNYLYDLLSRTNQKKAVVVNNFYNKGFENYYNQQVEKKNYIISIGNGFSKRKNIENALRAFAILRKKFPELEYHLVGNDMEEGGPAYRFCEQHNLLDGVVFVGRLRFNEVVEKVQAAKVALHPAREESFGMSVLESMLIGTPVVAGDKSGNIPHLLLQGKAGELCDINSPQKIAAAVTKLLVDDKYAEAIKLTAYHFAKDNFSEDKSVSDYLSYYNQVLSTLKK